MTINQFLQTIHAQQYKGLDDDMPEDYTEWVDNLSTKELGAYLEQYNLQKGVYANTNTR